jgi:hypothetical protein
MSFHDVSEIRFSVIEAFAHPDGGQFCMRSMTLVGANGDRFCLDLFASEAKSLRVIGDRETMDAMAKVHDCAAAPSDAEIPPAYNPKTGKMVPW